MFNYLLGVFMVTVVVGEPLLFTHDDFPGYQLSASDPSELSVDRVNQTSGYISTPFGENLFYWFFESRNDPSKDPVVLWLNGGPGCSSLEATLFENGPSFVQQDLKLQNNEWSWNNNASVIYLDQPSRVGYSTGGQVTSTVQASKDFNAFVQVFFDSFPQYKANPFHIAGESYAGRYIPVFAEAVNTDPSHRVRVSSIMIGNGLVSSVAEYQSYQPFMCGQGGFSSVLSETECEVMQAALPACTSTVRSCTNNDATGASCDLVSVICEAQTAAYNGRNPYDVRDADCTKSTSGLCYPGLDYVTNYFNQPQVKQALGVDSSVTYQVCNNDINSAFTRNFDGLEPTAQNVTNLLAMGVHVLAYHGDKDIILNWISGRTWTTDLVWSGQNEFRSAANTPTLWSPVKDGEPLGTAVNYDNLSFLRVFNAGHMVPHDQPESAYRMLRAWLSRDFAFVKNQA